MASRQSQANYSVPYPTNPSQQQLDLGDDDVKVPYDDLIDQYATPYQRQSDYKAYSISPNAPQAHTRRPSYPLSPKHSYQVEASGKDDSSDAHGPTNDWEYPPAAMKQDKIKEKPNFWATVRYLLLTIIA